MVNRIMLKSCIPARIIYVFANFKKELHIAIQLRAYTGKYYFDSESPANLATYREKKLKKENIMKK